MTKKLFILISCGLLLIAAGCKKDKSDEPEPFSSNVPSPDWIAPIIHDYTSSATAVVRVDLAAQHPDMAADFVIMDEDVLAAFSGNTCLGTATLQGSLFFLYIASPELNGGDEEAVSITLKYYSAHYKNIFVASDAFTFSSNAHLGTIAQPLVPVFIAGDK